MNATGLRFTDLWKNHPNISKDTKTCNYNNLCAVKLGIALQKSGVDTTKFNGAIRCGFHKKEDGHFLRAQELANVLKKHPIHGLSKIKAINPETFQKDLRGKKGIIFFKDYWKRSLNEGRKENFPTGDHIDLWNINQMTGTFSWLRLNVSIFGIEASDLNSNWSDHNDSKKVLFWEMAL